MKQNEIKEYSDNIAKQIFCGRVTTEEAILRLTSNTGCNKDFARKMINQSCNELKKTPVKSGYSNNPDYVGDWFGKGQIDFNAIINPEDDGDIYMVKMWCGSGYVLDVYLCKATNIYDAMDIVFNWSWEHEGHNSIVFDYDYVSKEAAEYYESDPDMFDSDLDEEDFEDRFISEYYVSNDYSLFCRSENFFVDKVPEDVLAKNEKPIENSKKPIKSAVDGGWVVDDYEADDAYNFAIEYFGEDNLNNQIIRAMSNEELAACLAFIFRMNDFREWEEHKNSEIESSRKSDK